MRLPLNEIQEFFADEIRANPGSRFDVYRPLRTVVGDSRKHRFTVEAYAVYLGLKMLGIYTRYFDRDGALRAEIIGRSELIGDLNVK